MKPFQLTRLPLIIRILGILMLFAGLHAEDLRAEDKDPDEPFEADQAYLKEHYTKYEYEIPMRDGVKLFTAVYTPKNQSSSYPILIHRTPYGIRPYGPDNYPAEPRGVLKYYAEERFIFVYQDVRGRNGSQGEFVHVRPHLLLKSTPADIDESSDTYDTIDWLIENVPNHNGSAGLMGISYPGFYSAAGMIDAHPALKCVSPQAPVTDWFIGDDFHHNGAFYLAHAFRFFQRFGQQLEKPTRQSAEAFDYETPNGYEFFLNIGPLYNINEKHFKNEILFWRELMDHGSYDEFWSARDILPHLKDIKPAVMTVGGWIRCRGPLWPAQGLRIHGEKLARRLQHSGDGALGARRLAPRRRGAARQCPFPPEDRAILPRSH